ncbi:MAG: Ornithine cyclodeaminase [Burkholderiaceae bacterium]|jgi:ornithine cyclodeaminase/alanine dehydrogenase-like protein (mu-crystallin family)|nr:MAG: Ornithine cyclodeaminase [Burkholderiaceae bacterium]
MLILDEAAVRKFLDLRALIPAMERALSALSAGKAVQPMRVMVPVAEHGGFLGSMPGYAGAQLGAKLVTFFPNNQGIPTHHALVLLFQPETGQPLVVMDGRLITEMRTGAVSAAATRLLARPDSSVLAILGSGAQAQSHLHALRLVREFREIRVWSPHNAGAFARLHQVRLAHSAEGAVRGADVIVVATTSRIPILRGEWLSPGVHINAVGAPRPDWRELDDQVLHKAKLYVESREAATQESGDVIAAGSGSIFAEIGEVVAGTKPGRQSEEEVTLFKSVGVAVEDLASAERVYREALAAQPPLAARP